MLEVVRDELEPACTKVVLEVTPHQFGRKPEEPKRLVLIEDGPVWREVESGAATDAEATAEVNRLVWLYRREERKKALEERRVQREAFDAMNEGRQWERRED